MEGALRHIESRYDLLAQHARDVILVLRREDGRILEANAAAAYGWSREALRGMTVYPLRAPGEAALVAAQLAAANAGTRFEAVHHRKDGSTFPVEVNSQGVELDGDRVLVAIIRDASCGRARRCDLMMPGMTGMELDDALAQVAPDQASRIVVLTGGAFTPRAREFLDRVALPCCEKPFDTETLRATVRRVVG